MTHLQLKTQAALLRLPDLLLACAMLCACGCGRGRPPVKNQFEVMGTFAAVSVSAVRSDQLDDCLAAARDTFGSVETAMSTYRPESEVRQLWKMAGLKPVTLSEGTYHVLSEAIRYSELSGGAFDVTVRPLLTAWGFRGGEPARPTPGELRGALLLVGAEHVVLKDNTVYLDTAGVEVDLGGIAKGYAVDLCFDRLRSGGQKDFLVNLGGNIRCDGAASGNRPWRVGVRNPFNGSELLGTLMLTDGLATATSGNYERFITIDGKRYPHILDPRTGQPVRDMAGVTVLSETAIEADALSTALFVMGAEDGAELIGRLDSASALFVKNLQPLEICITPAFAKYFQVEDEFKDQVLVLRRSSQ